MSRYFRMCLVSGRFFVAALLGVLLTSSPLLGQSSTGSVRGVVDDPTGAVIPLANISLTNTATGVRSRTTTNEAGVFVYPAVIPGSYRIEVTYSGMATYQGSLTVRVQESASLAITLRPAATQTEVTVVDVTPIVVVDNPTLGSTLERRRIEQLPINGRTVTNLLQTVAGVQIDSSGNIRTNAVRPGTHDFTLDGAALTDALDGGGTFRRQPGLDTIQEFRVENNAVSAKNPRQTNIVLTTKSGTNDIHGTLFATNRNNSIGVARARENMSNVAAHYVRNEYGGTVGGPVVVPRVYDGRNRTFWFFSYEGLRQRQGQIGGVAVPTEAMRNGDFSGLKTATGTPILIYDPFQTDPKTYSRPQFNYLGTPNRIDPSRISPLAKYIYGTLPLPTMPSVNPLVGNNYFGPRPDSTDEWTISARFDHQIREADRMYVRLTDSSSDRLRASKLPATTDGGGNWRRDYFPSKSIAVNWLHTFSPTFFSEFTASASREYGSIYTGEPGTLWANQLGLPNPANQDGYPVIGTVGVRSSGNYLQPQNNRIRYFNFFIIDDHLTRIYGKHEFQFGVHLRKDYLNWLPQQQRTGGSASAIAVATALYDPTQVSRARGVLNTGHTAASFFLGLNDLQYRTAKQKYYMRQQEAALYFQDNFRVTPRLTVNLGLRWQFTPFAYDKYNIMTSWDPANQAVVLGQPLDFLYRMGATNPGLVKNLMAAGMKFETASQAGLPDKLVFNNWRDIGPHIGFAYRALEGRRQFIVRAGYSINYFPLPMAPWNDRMRLNAPFTGFYENRPYASTSTSPDGRRNWGLVGVPQLISGLNTANSIDLNDARALEVGGDAFQASYWGSQQPSPRVHDWNFTIEKEVMAQTVMRLSLTGAHARHQDTLDDQNEVISEYVWYSTRGVPLPEDFDAVAAQRPMYRPGFPMGDIQEFRRDGYGNSVSFLAEVERRFSKGLGYQFIYVLNNNAYVGGYGYNSVVAPASSFLPGQVPTDRKERMRLLGYQRDISIPKHDFRWNWIYELPFGKGQTFLKNASPLLNHLVGGWQITGMGRLRSNYFSLPTDIWPGSNAVEYYGHKYPIKDCRSGECYDGWLLWNGYIPAHQINQPDGIMGVPANYKPAAQTLWPYPANYASLNPNNDPNYGYYGTNIVFIPMKDGSVQEVEKSWNGDVYSGFGALHPWINQPVLSTNTWTVDASVNKNFAITERFRLRVQADFFNVLNVPGNNFTPLD
ncbi:MAG: carboxypeptidase regulatory-like domain-containing protein, partial [Bryobacterales bacterium]|nr:carboxypeptidase regulatory-like domain-containing protein [Bryobacterales bacterium]